MKAELKLLKTSINNLVNLTKGLTNEQLNRIPEGFSNNIIWNLAHLVVTQKLLIYGLSGNKLKLANEFVELYRKGSKPNGEVNEKECQFIFSLLEGLFSDLEQDLKTIDFDNFKNYPTSYNYEITNLNEAVSFNNLHFGLHFAFLLKLLKQIK